MKGRIRVVIGILLSILLLWWALRDVSAAEVIHRIRAVEPTAFTLAIGVALAGFWIRAFRWRILLLPIDRNIPFQPLLGATFIGFAANNLLPARVGEFARAYALARLTQVRVASAFATLVIERLLDGLVVVALLFAAMAHPDFPAPDAGGGLNIRGVAILAASLVALAVAGLFLAVTSPGTAARLARAGTRMLPTRTHDPILAALRSFAIGLAVLRSPALFLTSLLLALGQWIFLAVSFLLGFRAFGIDHVPFSGAVLLQSVISLAVALPSSPGFFGPFEAAARAGLALWGVPGEQAISFAIGFHIAGFLPVTLIGIYYLWRLDLSWSEVRQSEIVVEDDIDAGARTGVADRR